MGFLARKRRHPLVDVPGYTDHDYLRCNAGGYRMWARFRNAGIAAEEVGQYYRSPCVHDIADMFRLRASGVSARQAGMMATRDTERACAIGDAGLFNDWPDGPRSQLAVAYAGTAILVSDIVRLVDAGVPGDGAAGYAKSGLSPSEVVMLAESGVPGEAVAAYAELGHSVSDIMRLSAAGVPPSDAKCYASGGFTLAEMIELHRSHVNARVAEAMGAAGIRDLRQVRRLLKLESNLGTVLYYLESGFRLPEEWKVLTDAGISGITAKMLADLGVTDPRAMRSLVQAGVTFMPPESTPLPIRDPGPYGYRRIKDAWEAGWEARPDGTIINIYREQAKEYGSRGTGSGTFVANYDGWCSGGCDEGIEIGDTIRRMSDGTYQHEECP